MTTLLVTVGALLLLALLGVVALEHWLRTHGLDRLERLVGEHLDTPCTLSVTVADGPVGHVRSLLWDRRLPGVTLHARGVPVAEGRARLASLEAWVDDLPLTGPRLQPRPADAPGVFRAYLHDRELTGLLGLPPVVQGLFVHGDGLRVTTVAGVAVTCDVVLGDAGIVVRPRSPGALARLPWPQVVTPLPDLPLDARVERLELVDGHAVAEGTFDAGSLRW